MNYIHLSLLFMFSGTMGLSQATWRGKGGDISMACNCTGARSMQPHTTPWLHHHPAGHLGASQFLHLWNKGIVIHTPANCISMHSLEIIYSHKSIKKQCTLYWRFPNNTLCTALTPKPHEIQCSSLSFRLAAPGTCLFLPPYSTVIGFGSWLHPTQIYPLFPRSLWQRPLACSESQFPNLQTHIHLCLSKWDLLPFKINRGL